MSRYHAASARLAIDHGPTFPAWRAKARPAIEEAFSGVSEDDESDWFAIARDALSGTLPHTMYRGFSVRAKSAAEARRLAKAEIRKSRRALPHSFSKAVARSFAVGVEPYWAAGGAVSDSGMRARQGKAGQWGIILSVEVAPDMVDWGCLRSGNAMFGEHVYDLLPFEGPPGEYMAEVLVENGGVSNVEWDLEVKPYPPGSARVEAFRIGPGDTEETEELWQEWAREAARAPRRAGASRYHAAMAALAGYYGQQRGYWTALWVSPSGEMHDVDDTHHSWAWDNRGLLEGEGVDLEGWYADRLSDAEEEAEDEARRDLIRDRAWDAGADESEVELTEEDEDRIRETAAESAAESAGRGLGLATVDLLISRGWIRVAQRTAIHFEGREGPGLYDRCEAVLAERFPDVWRRAGRGVVVNDDEVDSSDIQEHGGLRAAIEAGSRRNRLLMVRR